MFNLLITIVLTVIQVDGIDRLTHSYDDLLTKVLQWEILWNQTPSGFHSSPNGRVRIAAYREQRSFAYCSRDLGVCVEYRTDVNRNWQGTRSAVCDQNQTNEECLMTFTNRPKPSGQSRPPVNVGPGGLGGLAGQGLLWSTTITLKNRNEIIQQYQGLHSSDVEDLASWLRTDLRGPYGYRSITIPCFAASDPVIYVYGERRQGPIIISVYWDKERQEWREAGLLEGRDSLRQIEEIHGLIDKIKCSVVSFN